MEITVLTNAADIFEQGNLHMKNKLRHFGEQGRKIVKYIISALRKYNGEFFEKYKAIAEKVGCSYPTVKNTIKTAEKLGIFAVAERSEETINGKMRKTTNCIYLLPYKEVEKKVVSTIRTVAAPVVEEVPVEETPEAAPVAVPKKPPVDYLGTFAAILEADIEKHSAAPTPKKQWSSKKSGRSEMLPDWLPNYQTGGSQAIG